MKSALGVMGNFMFYIGRAFVCKEFQELNKMEYIRKVGGNPE
jgi:hypothetical protein